MKNVYVKSIILFLIIILLNSCSNTSNFFRAPDKPESFSVALNSPQIPIGETEAQFENPIPFANLKKAAVNISYYPLEDTVCLYYKINGINYYQFWRKEARNLFINALENYNEDFDSKTLIRSMSKTKNVYGTTLGYLIWQEFKFTEQADANMDLIFGYYFKKQSPFFTITQGEAKYVHLFSDRNRTSGEKPIYLTKAQADAIASFFNEELLMGSIPEELKQIMNPNIIIKTGLTDIDVY